jgi:hypothetical protein
VYSIINCSSSHRQKSSIRIRAALVLKCTDSFSDLNPHSSDSEEAAYQLPAGCLESPLHDVCEAQFKISRGFVPNQAYEMRRFGDYGIGCVFRSTPNSFLHHFVALQNACLAVRHNPFHCNPAIDLRQSRPRFDRAGPVCKYCRLLYSVSVWSPSPVGGVNGYLNVCALESDLPTGISGKRVIDVDSKYIRIPSTKERRSAQHGIRVFTEV